MKAKKTNELRRKKDFINKQRETYAQVYHSKTKKQNFSHFLLLEVFFIYSNQYINLFRSLIEKNSIDSRIRSNDQPYLLRVTLRNEILEPLLRNNIDFSLSLDDLVPN